MDGLDIKSWVVNKDEKDTIYDLYAVSNHFGGLGGGHYTAYGKNILDNKWYNLDDSSVQPLGNPNQVRTAAAYVLFYRRRGRVPGQTKHTLESTQAQAAALGMKVVGGQPVTASASASAPAATTPTATATATAAASTSAAATAAAPPNSKSHSHSPPRSRLALAFLLSPFYTLPAVVYVV